MKANISPFIGLWGLMVNQIGWAIWGSYTVEGIIIMWIGGSVTGICFGLMILRNSKNEPPKTNT